MIAHISLESIETLSPALVYAHDNTSKKSKATKRSKATRHQVKQCILSVFATFEHTNSLGSVYLCIVECIPCSWFFGGWSYYPAFSCDFPLFGVSFLLVCIPCIVCIPFIE